MALDDPSKVRHHLGKAGLELSAAHEAAGETEGEATNLIGSVRDLIFGLNTAVEALDAAIAEGRFG